MSEWELRVSHRELQRTHVVGVDVSRVGKCGRGAKLLGSSPR
jgi:hypothetical protein